MRSIFGLILVGLLAGAPAQASEEAALINGYRAQKGLAPLSESPALARTAQRHAQDMARRGFFSHAGSDGSNVMIRARRAGYGACNIAENIAKGQRGLNQVMRDWMTSAGHRKNMLRPELAHFGLARVTGNIWVLVLGRDGC